MAATVIGREQELDAIAAFLEDAERGLCALVFSGEPGIGKTVLEAHLSRVYRKLDVRRAGLAVRLEVAAP